MTTFKILVPIFLLGILNSCDVETPLRAAKYNDKIITETDKATAEYDKIMTTYNNSDSYEEVHIVIDEAKETAKQSIKTIQALGDFYEDNTLNEAGINYIEKISETCDLFHQSLDMEEAEDTGAEYDALDEKINSHTDVAHQNLMDTQIIFAVKHDYELK